MDVSPVISAAAASNHCVFDDTVNEALVKMQEADGLIVGSPVYYASLNGALSAFLDRMFCCGDCFHHKPAAAVASARRIRNNSDFGYYPEIFYDQPDAVGFFPVLEHGSRRMSGGCGKRSGRSSDDADSRSEYGVDVKMY